MLITSYGVAQFTRLNNYVYIVNGDGLDTYHSDSNERQGGKLRMVSNEEGMGKWRPKRT